MSKPVIFTIDDDSSVLNSIERDLRAQYGQNYRILPIDSGTAALDYLKKLGQRKERSIDLIFIMNLAEKL